jgi:hypothetical protein
VLENYTEFEKRMWWIVDNVHFDLDINVSVFETNIRILGGMLKIVNYFIFCFCLLLCLLRLLCLSCLLTRRSSFLPCADRRKRPLDSLWRARIPQ